MFFDPPLPPPAAPPAPPAFIEVAADVGLANHAQSRLLLADLNGDGRPDLVLDRRIVLLNTVDASAPRGFRFVAAPESLPMMGDTPAQASACVTVFADFDNDGHADAIMSRDADPDSRYESNHGNDGHIRSAPAVYCPGKGDGTFGKALLVPVLGPAHTAALAVGDVNGDGKLDLYRGNWYRKYGESLDATPGDLLVQNADDAPPASFRREVLSEDVNAFAEDTDIGGRPTYGAMIARFDAGRTGERTTDRATAGPAGKWPAQVAQLNYGRRWNRLYLHTEDGWLDVAPATGFDGDAERNGAYPAWLAERAKADKRFERADEKPFRANGNTFDMSVGDVNNDGLFDCFVAEIAHAWAGASSDRSRFMLAERADTPIGVRFTTPAWASVDRIPPGDGPESRSWNQGDLFCELMDVDNDSLLDLVLASGDYPDAPPFDERLRIFRQRAEPGPDGRLFEDVTAAFGIDLPGAAQLSVGDIDLDGDMDIVCAQSFTRFTKDMVEAAGGVPRVRVFLNQASDRGAPGRTLTLTGDPTKGVSRDAIGAVVVATTPGGAGAAGAPATLGAAAELPRVRTAQLVGPGGHSGKQRALQVHFGGATDATTFELPAGVSATIHGGAIAVPPRDAPAAIKP